MTLNTSLSNAPYFDDYTPDNQYHRILFKPSDAVQARELNQLQSILQNQVEKFGDNIYKKGTIIEGCSLIYHDSIPFVKIKDSASDGTPVNVSEYNNLSIKNSSNVNAFIVKTIEGFESRTSDLNTLFVKYNSSGNDSNTSSFSPGETLTIYSPNQNLFKVRVIDGSSGFANTDTIEIISAIAVQNSSGGSTFPVGAFNQNDTIQNGVANATIIEANNTLISNALVLKIKPLVADLKTANNIKWSFSQTETIINANTGNTASISSIIGKNAKASLLTNSLGKITTVSITNQGTGYSVIPFVATSITSNSNISTSDINQTSLVAENFLTSVVVANSSFQPIGTGYGITVDDGVIYQKGFFSSVKKQLTIVNKYSNTGFTKSVGFLTEESLINSNQDQSLLDNATGSPNFTAPGADRLKLNPILYVLEKTEADANTEFLPIVEFTDGSPYRQNRNTIYNIIGDEIAKRTFEESGNYVLDQFNLITKDSKVFTETPEIFKINIDPGKAYIQGYRVETTTNYSANVAKGTDFINLPNSITKIGYGNYVKVKELGGIFQFNTGDSVKLYDTFNTYITSNAGSTISPTGTLIGEARIRSLILDSGEPGTNNAVYRLYLFDIVMSTGNAFSAVKSIFYDGTNKGICDTVPDIYNQTSLVDTTGTGLLFKPINAVKSANNLAYTYRTLNQNKQANTTGFITVTPSTNEAFPYTGTLNSIEKQDIIVIPLNDFQGGANTSGGITTTASSNTITGTGAMDFLASFRVGEFIKLANSTASTTKQITNISNTTSMMVSSNVTSNMTGNVVSYFPKNIPISLNIKDSRSVIIAANGQMTISLGSGIANTTGSTASANVAVVYNVNLSAINPAVKTSNRDIYSRIDSSNNIANTIGPWALGVSDVYRLKNVYTANSATHIHTFNANTNVGNNFITITDNRFANGDSITYTTGSGGTALTGLANNTLYYAVAANTTGMSLSASRGGSTITLVPTSSSQIHNITGRPLYFSDNTNGVTDVTNEFYIDNNQKEDYLDISYLYRKPRLPNIAANTVLLVKYDCFTSGSGVKTVSSYNINDSANLSSLSLSTSINTLEIPEMVGTDGKYYDIRDQIDFRPSSSNTIPYTTDASSLAIVNPLEPSNALRFSSSEQLFPVPNSNLNVNITHYVPRNDRVILDKEGDFVVVKGVPNVVDTFPTEPADSITLQYLNIPPYPSLPFSLSQDTVEIIDTKVANEKYGKRKDNFKITTPIDKNQRARIQTKNYKMSDIATLERRMKDLEYYVSFTLAEVATKNRYIPSKVSSALGSDRFKFGFFVDPFSDYSFSDKDNPEYWASISDDVLSPKRSELNIEFLIDNAITGDFITDSTNISTLPFIEYEIISQNDATIEKTSISQTRAVVSQEIVRVIENQKNFSNKDTVPYVFDENYYTFSNTSGPVELYLKSRDNNMAIEIYQATTQNGPWLLNTSSAAGIGITQTDINLKGLNVLGGGNKFEGLGSINRKSYGPAGGFIEDQFKLLFNHDIAKGIFYKIVIYKGKNHGGQGTKGSYSYALFYPSDVVSTVTSTIDNNPSNFNYIGVVNTVSPDTFTLSSSFNDLNNITDYIPSGGYVADAQKFNIIVSGLKASTKHEFYFNGELKTDKCRIVRSSSAFIGDSLISDNSGNISFDYYYDAGINESTSDVLQQYKLLSSIAGTKIFTLKDPSSSSFAVGSIELKFYTSITPELTGSFGSVNAPIDVNGQYNYGNNINQIVDLNQSINSRSGGSSSRDWQNSNVELV